MIESLAVTTDRLHRLQETLDNFGFAVDKLIDNPHFNDF